MEKYNDVLKRSIELLETVHEGLLHILKKLNEGHFEDTIYLFEDAVEAFSVIERSLNVIPKDILNEDVTELTMKVKNVIELVVSAYELKDHAKVKEILQFSLIPRCKKWNETLADISARIIVS
jgi:hypothetical protein